MSKYAVPLFTVVATSAVSATSIWQLNEKNKQEIRNNLAQLESLWSNAAHHSREFSETDQYLHDLYACQAEAYYAATKEHQTLLTLPWWKRVTRSVDLPRCDIEADALARLDAIYHFGAVVYDGEI